MTVRIHGLDSSTWQGKIVRLEESEMKTVPPMLSNRGGGPVTVKPPTGKGGLVPQSQHYLAYIDTHRSRQGHRRRGDGAGEDLPAARDVPALGVADNKQPVQPAVDLRPNVARVSDAGGESGPPPSAAPDGTGTGVQALEWIKVLLLVVIAVAAAMIAGQYLFRLS